MKFSRHFQLKSNIQAKEEGMSESERTRFQELMWVQIILLALLLLTVAIILILQTGRDAGLFGHIGTVAGLFVIMLIAYHVNLLKHYKLSAILTFSCSVIGPAAIMILDNSLINGDYLPVVFTAVSVILCSILFRLRVTIVIAALEIVGIFAFFICCPDIYVKNWPGLLTLILFLCLLSGVYNYIMRSRIQKIEAQKQQLAKSEAELRELSMRDPLTSLFNRRYMEETFEREIKRATRKLYGIGVMMLDIDHFKRLNDLHGHGAGDMVLKSIGEYLQRVLRDSDIACRYGGDEIILIMPEASKEITRERALKIRRDIKQMQFEYEGRVIGHLTISVGIAAFPQNGNTAAEIIKEADKALYRAKHEGRNRVIVQPMQSVLQPTQTCMQRRFDI